MEVRYPLHLVSCGILTLSILNGFSTVSQSLVIYGHALKCGFLALLILNGFFHGYSITCGSFRACRFAAFEIVSCRFLTLSILHWFSTIIQSLVVVLGRAGLQPLKLCYVMRNFDFVDSPRIFHGYSITCGIWVCIEVRIFYVCPRIFHGLINHL